MEKPENQNCPVDSTTEITVADLVTLTGIGRQTLSTKLEALQVPMRKGARGLRYFKLAEILKISFQLLSSAEKSADDDKKRLSKAKAELAELQLAEKRREVIPAQDALAVAAENFAEVRTALLNLGPSIARDLANQTDPEIISDIIDQKLEQALAPLSVPIVANDPEPV